MDGGLFVKGSFTLGRVGGVQIKADLGWVLILGLVAAGLANLYFPQAHPGWTAAIRWMVGSITALMLLVSVLVHELAHTLASNRLGMPVTKISLFIFGGMTQIESLPEWPSIDLKTALSGPAMTLLLYLSLILLSNILGYLNVSEIVVMALFYGAQINLVLLLLNMVPVFPLDGGRVLRALIWRFKGDFQSATKIAAATGNGFGYILILIGLYLILLREYLFAVWFIFNGWYRSSPKLCVNYLSQNIELTDLGDLM